MRPPLLPTCESPRMDAGHDALGFLTPERVRGHFDRAVAHWNAGAYFEAHEDWEVIWHEAEGARREWLQGLIQLAAAFVHVGRDNASGMVKLTRSAAVKAGGYGGDTAGIDFAAFWREIVPWLAHAERVANGHPMRADAPPIPAIRYLPGVVPCPLPPEPEASDDVDA